MTKQAYNIYPKMGTNYCDLVAVHIMNMSREEFLYYSLFMRDLFRQMLKSNNEA